MEVFVNDAGERVFINAPRIDQVEMKRNVVLYDPNNYNLSSGLYERSQPSCQRWVDHFYQYQKQHPVPPLYSVDQNGNTHPNYENPYERQPRYKR